MALAHKHARTCLRTRTHEYTHTRAHTPTPTHPHTRATCEALHSAQQWSCLSRSWSLTAPLLCLRCCTPSGRPARTRITAAMSKSTLCLCCCTPSCQSACPPAHTHTHHSCQTQALHSSQPLHQSRKPLRGPRLPPSNMPHPDAPS